MQIRGLSLTNNDLRIEREQLIEEGRDITPAIEEAFKQFEDLNLAEDPSFQTRAQALLDSASGLPRRKDYPYREPSDLEGIRHERPRGYRQFTNNFPEEALYDRILGAWLGRCSGCLLGKPVEHWLSGMMWPYLKELGRYPLSEYFRSDVPDEIIEKYHVDRQRAYIDRVPHMVEDDDTNYTVAGLAIMDRYGAGFTPEDVATFWLEHLPILHTYTAERIAYRNFANLIPPPNSASYRNPFREWIGAQIRADFWGYIAIGNPEQAAEFAWRDASISHTGNGIYGEMWVAAMLAAAPFVDDMRDLVEVGLQEIPSSSRFTENIHQVLDWHKRGLEYEAAVGEIHQKWDETWRHHWCHVLSNAQIVAVGLLWGENDFEKSICRAVQACFDTDCNGATVGSILGMRLGALALPGKWTGPLHDGLETGIGGYPFIEISAVAQKTLDLT